MTAWVDGFQTANPDVKVQYNPVGSGAGRKGFLAEQYQFAGSDSAMDEEEQADAAKVCGTDGAVQVPGYISPIAVAFNLPGVEHVNMDADTIAQVFTGKIKKWNEKPVADLNPSLKLPDELITVVRRSDGSGTTFIWTDYLSKVSPEWKQKVGSSTAVSWPEGVGGKGNEGVAAYVQRIKGSVGYVEYAYAKRNRMTHGAVQNRDGQFVQPDDDTFQAAAAFADWKNAPGFYQILTDQPGKTSWPISGASFILMYAKPDKPQNTAEVLKFFAWAYKNGKAMATELDYVPMPDPVVKIVEDAWRTQIKDAPGKALWN